MLLNSETRRILPSGLRVCNYQAHTFLGHFPARRELRYGVAVFSISAFRCTLLPPLTFTFRSQSLNPVFFTEDGMLALSNLNVGRRVAHETAVDLNVRASWIGL